MFKSFETLIPLIASVTHEIKTIHYDMVASAIIERDEAIKLTELELHEAMQEIMRKGVKPIDIKYIVEEGFIICRDTILELGEFDQGLIEPQHILKALSNCNEYIGFVHTHPIPLPIPSPEDLYNAYQLQSKLECIASKMDVKGVVVCIITKSREEWLQLYKLTTEFSGVLYNSTSQYIVLSDGEGIYFLPYPSTEEAYKIVYEYKDVLDSSGIHNLLIIGSRSSIDIIT